MAGAIVIYGATGYTGKLVAAQARRAGYAPVLAGRNGGKLLEVAGPLGFDARTAHLEDAASLDRLLKGAGAVLNIAGPFSRTAKPMIDACLRAGAHYLDVTGEIAVFEACAARSAEAERAGVMLLPGAGFDVVPSDCLAAHVAQRLPGARRLVLGISGLGTASRGTMKTGLESAGRGTAVRRGGEIVALKRPPRRLLDFGEGPVAALGVGWGDVATAYYTTGIPDIEVYFKLTPALGRAMGFAGRFGWLMRLEGLQRFLAGRIDRGPEGPSAEERAASPSVIVAEVEDDAGRHCRARLATPNGYSLTAMTAIDMAARAARGEARPGFTTPARQFGADYILGFPGVVREDLS